VNVPQGQNHGLFLDMMAGRRWVRAQVAIGMVGIGLMGHGIASNLVKHGHSLVVLEHPATSRWTR
jgi:hypothetical protein